MQCVAHPDTETELGCSRCGKAICPRCLVYTPVGSRCRECANVRRIPTYNVKPATFARAIAGGIAAGVVLGIAWAIFNLFTYFFFGIIAGLAIGYAAGEIVSLAANRRAGPPLQAIAVGAVVLAFALRLLLLIIFDNWIFEDIRVDIAGLIALGVGGFVAAGRLR